MHDRSRLDHIKHHGPSTNCVDRREHHWDLSKDGDAPRSLAIEVSECEPYHIALCSECTLITASLTELQTYILQNPSMQSRPELRTTFDMALTGCVVVFSCFDQEVRKIAEVGPSKLTWRSKAKFIWNEDTMKEYLSQIRGQQAALSLLIQLLHMRSIDEINQKLIGNEPLLRRQSATTESLRAAHPEIKVPESIFENSNSAPSVYGDTSTIFTAAEFDFDDAVINSKAYRRALAAARASSSTSKIESNLNPRDPKTNENTPGESKETQQSSLEIESRKPVVDFDLIDLHFDFEAQQSEYFEKSSLERRWGQIETTPPALTLLDKSPEVTVDQLPTIEMNVREPQGVTAESLPGIETLTGCQDLETPDLLALPLPGQTLETQAVSLHELGGAETDEQATTTKPIKCIEITEPGLPVIVTPAVVIFYWPSDLGQGKILSLINPNNNWIIFTIKNNNPRRYTIYPNRGQIGPLGRIRALVALIGRGGRLRYDEFSVQSSIFPQLDQAPWGGEVRFHGCAEVMWKAEIDRERPPSWPGEDWNPSFAFPPFIFLLVFTLYFGYLLSGVFET